MAEEIYIKVYPERLRALMRDFKLTRAEACELVLLALYIDENNVCWPGRYDSAEKIGMKSGDWARSLHKRLKKKGVLDYDFNHSKSSPRFKLPDAFAFGGNSYQAYNSETGGYRDSETGGYRDSETGGYRDSTTEQDSSLTRPIEKKNHKNIHPVDHPEKWNGELPLVLSDDQRFAIRTLTEAGVNDVESYLISLQFKTETIREAITELMRSTKQIANPGAWVRTVIELKANKQIEYPQIHVNALRAAAAVAVTSVKMSSPYQEQLSRYDQQMRWQDDDAEDGADHPF